MKTLDFNYLFQLYAPTTLAPPRDFWLLRYTSVLEDGSLVVCDIWNSFIFPCLDLIMRFFLRLYILIVLCISGL